MVVCVGMCVDVGYGVCAWLYVAVLAVCGCSGVDFFFVACAYFWDVLCVFLSLLCEFLFLVYKLIVCLLIWCDIVRCCVLCVCLCGVGVGVRTGEGMRIVVYVGVCL